MVSEPMRTKSKDLPIDAPYNFYYFQHAHRRIQKAMDYLGMCSRFSI
jgi:glutamate/tyrosine decarboxylase-like PLP-dependent enzyme